MRTDEGRTATIPDGLPDLVFSDDDWQIFKRAGRDADRTPPPDSGNQIAPMLPASEW